jgi:hypothetical protein
VLTSQITFTLGTIIVMAAGGTLCDKMVARDGMRVGIVVPSAFAKPYTSVIVAH